MLGKLVWLAFIPLSGSACNADPGLVEASRSLFQAPARAAAFFEGGTAAASGGAVLVFPDGAPPSEGYVVQLPGEPLSLACAGRTVWAAAGEAGMVPIDVSDPAGPVAGPGMECGKAVSCAVVGHWLLVSLESGSLLLYDVSDPAAPERAGKAAPSVRATRVSAGPGWFAAAGRDTAWTVAPGPEGPEIISEIVPGGRIVDIAASGGMLYILDAEGKVLACDTGSGAPCAIRRPGPRGVADIASCGDRVLGLLEDGRIVEMGKGLAGDGEGVRYSLLVRDGAGISSRFPGSSLACSSGRLAVFSPEDGFRFYRVRGDEASPAGSIETRGFAIDVIARDGYLYLANGRDGLRVGRVLEDGGVEWTGRVPAADARDVDLDGDILALADGAAGVKFFSISGDPPRLELEGELDSPFYISAVKARNGVAFLAGGLGGAEMIDYGDPSSPRLIWRGEFSEVRGVEADDGYFYLADGFEGFHIYSFSSTPPVRVGGANTPGWNCDLFVEGDVLYAAEGGNGLMTLDISDRSRPVALDTLSIGSIAREIHAHGGTLFVASHRRGLTAVDVSDPGDIRIAASHPTVDDARGVYADDDFVYLASGSGGLYIFRYR